MEALISAGNGSVKFLVRNFQIVITKKNALTHTPQNFKSASNKIRLDVSISEHHE